MLHFVCATALHDCWLFSRLPRCLCGAGVSRLGCIGMLATCTRSGTSRSQSLTQRALRLCGGMCAQRLQRYSGV